MAKAGEPAHHSLTTLRGAAAELPALAEAPEVEWHNRLDRVRLDTKGLQRAAVAPGLVRNDVVAPKQPHLVGGEQWLRHELQGPGCELGQPERQRHQQAAPFRGGEDEFHDLAEREDLRST